jgi:uncharacterized protein (TIGR02246 family)
MKSVLMLMLGLALTAGSATAQPAATQAQSSLARVYAQRLAEWEAAANRKDASSIAALYTEDALLMPPNAPSVRGRAAVEAFFKGMFDQGARDVKLVQIGAAGSGGSGYAVGTYEFTAGPVGTQAIHDKGKFITGMKRAADGKWRIADDVFNSDLPCPPAPARR